MITLTINDSKRKQRKLIIISGFVKESGQKVAKILSDNGKYYRCLVNADGAGRCECEGNKEWHRTCYHMKALLHADMPTADEVTAMQPSDRNGLVTIADAVAVIEQYCSEVDAYEILAETKQVSVKPVEKHYGTCGHLVKAGCEDDMCGGCYQKMFL